MGYTTAMISQSWQLQKHQFKELYACTKHRRKIKKYMDFLFTKYEKILNYLYIDYKQKKIMLKDSEGIINSTVIKDEIEDTRFYKDKLTFFLFPSRKRYYTFRILHHYLGQVSQILYYNCNRDFYKDINFKEIEHELEEMKPYIIKRF